MKDPQRWTTRGYLGEIPPVVVFEAAPASVLSRLLAWIIDIAVIWAAIVVLSVLFGGYDSSASSDKPDFRRESQKSEEGDATTGASILLTFSYFVVAERITGKTVGKKVMNIKVVNKYDGELVSFGQSIGRNLLRVVDLFPFGLIGLISMERSDLNQRVGDRVMSTIVIVEKSR